MRRTFHLTRRFLGSLSPRDVDPGDDAWARAHLLPGEVDLWERMPRADRTHAAGVAREVDRRLGGAERAVVAAALLHDVGKIEAGLGTAGRVAATVVAGIAGRERVARGEGRIARYLRHDEIGARLLTEAGSDQRTVAWAGEHHRRAAEWTLDPEIAATLAAVDDD